MRASTRVVGTKGTLWADGDTVHVATDDKPEGRVLAPPGFLALPDVDALAAGQHADMTLMELPPYIRLTEAFRRAIEGAPPGPGPHPATFADGLATMHVYAAVRRSAADKGRWITPSLSHVPQSPLHEQDQRKTRQGRSGNMSAAKPIVVGVLGDRPGDQSAMVGVMRDVVDAAVASGSIDRPVQCVVDITDGLPEGTAASVTAGFHRLVAQDALVIMGPTVTDNGLVATELADEFRIPCCNWTGSDRTRSEWMFHYQIGSLEEEPHLIAGHLESLGHQRVALVQDRSPSGTAMGAFFEDATERLGLQITSKTLISPVSSDLSQRCATCGRGDRRPGVSRSRALCGHARPRHGRRRLAPPVFANSALMFGYAFPEWVKNWKTGPMSTPGPRRTNGSRISWPPVPMAPPSSR